MTFGTWLSRDRSLALLLFIHASILMVVITALSPQACIRYLQPVSVLTLLGIAICVDWLGHENKAGGDAIRFLILPPSSNVF
jgi:hypothetical protein